jgi:hypothetical protein
VERTFSHHAATPENFVFPRETFTRIHLLLFPSQEGFTWNARPCPPAELINGTLALADDLGREPRDIMDVPLPKYHESCNAGTSAQSEFTVQDLRHVHFAHRQRPARHVRGSNSLRLAWLTESMGSYEHATPPEIG